MRRSPRFERRQNHVRGDGCPAEHFVTDRCHNRIGHRAKARTDWRLADPAHSMVNPRSLSALATMPSPRLWPATACGRSPAVKMALTPGIARAALVSRRMTPRVWQRAERELREQHAVDADFLGVL